MDEAAAHGLDADEIAAAHPHLIHVAIGDFGRTGPRAGWRLEPLPAFASSGALHASGFPDRPPCWLPGFLAHDCASVFAAFGAVAAWMDRRRTGRGQLVDVSVQEAALSGTNPWSIILSDYVRINPQLPTEGRRNADATYYVLPAGDGHVRAVLGSERHWQGFLDVLGRPDALEGDEWMTPGFRIMNADVIRLVAQESLLDRTRQEVFEQALAAGTPMGVVHTLSEFVAAEQTRARGFFSSAGPAGADGPFAEAAWKLDATPARVRRPAPEPGADDGGFEPRTPVAPTGQSGLLLDGVRVVEFGVAAVVPEMCWLLSELGAEVIKIESRAHPDVLRQTGGADLDCGFAYNAECRGRENVALDLTTERGRDLAYELCVGADIVAENNRGGVMDAWGLGADVLRAAQPPPDLRRLAGVRAGRSIRRDAGLRAAQLGVRRYAPAVEPRRLPLSLRDLAQPPRPHRGEALGDRRARCARSPGAHGGRPDDRHGPDRGGGLPDGRPVPRGGSDRRRSGAERQPQRPSGAPRRVPSGGRRSLDRDRGARRRCVRAPRRRGRLGRTRHLEAPRGAPRRPRRDRRAARRMDPFAATPTRPPPCCKPPVSRR